MTTAVGPPRQDRLERDLDALSRLTEPDMTGWTRRVFRPAFTNARGWVADTMADAGLDVRIDPSGNVVGRLAGTDADAAALVTGSHTDTVAGGGRFDGILGVLGAIEMVRSMRDQGVRLAHDLLVVDFLGEEPNEFGLSCVGSRAIAGNLDTDHLARRDPSGRTLADAFDSVGLDPDHVTDARWDPAGALAFVELHIEQGPVLEAQGLPVGVVDVIAGIDRFRAEFRGRGDHAGTAPMDVRRDAACAAAEAMVSLEQLAAGGGGVATVGRFDSEPGSMNIVPELARLWGELRSPDAAWLAERRSGFEAAATEAGDRRRVEAAVDWLSSVAPTPCEAMLQLAIEGAADSLGLSTMRIPSGAGHDAVQMASVAPTAMVFVPSKDGRSHVPEEWTDPDQCALGVHVLMQTMVDLDTQRAG